MMPVERCIRGHVQLDYEYMSSFYFIQKPLEVFLCFLHQFISSFWETRVKAEARVTVLYVIFRFTAHTVHCIVQLISGALSSICSSARFIMCSFIHVKTHHLSLLPFTLWVSHSCSALSSLRVSFIINSVAVGNTHIHTLTKNHSNLFLKINFVAFLWLSWAVNWS